jgi:hypothetical protein
MGAAAGKSTDVPVVRKTESKESVNLPSVAIGSKGLETKSYTDPPVPIQSKRVVPFPDLRLPPIPDEHDNEIEELRLEPVLVRPRPSQVTEEMVLLVQNVMNASMLNAVPELQKIIKNMLPTEEALKNMIQQAVAGSNATAPQLDETRLSEMFQKAMLSAPQLDKGRLLAILRDAVAAVPQDKGGDMIALITKFLREKYPSKTSLKLSLAAFAVVHCSNADGTISLDKIEQLVKTIRMNSTLYKLYTLAKTLNRTSTDFVSNSCQLADEIVLEREFTEPIMQRFLSLPDYNRAVNYSV